MSQAPAGCVSATRRDAITAGEAILQSGGTATDAAIAACFVLGVVEPYMTGPGALAEFVHVDPAGRCDVIDGAARAPMAATADMYGEIGEPGGSYGWPRVAGRRNEVHGASTTAPRLVAALARAHEQLGSLPWPTLLEPAIELARAGWYLDYFSAACLSDSLPDLRADPAAAALYDPDGTGPRFGTDDVWVRLTNPDLAATLELIAADGPEALRSGPLARDLLAAAAADGGVLAATDLAAVSAELHTDVAPLVRFRDWSVFGAALPSGAVTSAQILGILDRRPPASHPLDAGWYVDVAGACAVALGDRLSLLSGDDPPENVAAMLSPASLDEAAGRAVTIHGRPARPASSRPAAPTATTHVSVIDAQGNAVSLTTTLLSVFGARTVVPGRGFCLNNGMMWFDPRPGRSNSIRPGARALAAVSPVVLLDPTQRRRIALGALGARRIMSAVAQIAAVRIDCDVPPEVAVDLPRVHVDAVEAQIDERLPDTVLGALRDRGFDAVRKPYGPANLTMARANCVELGDDGFRRGIDKRAADTWSYGT